MPVGILAAGRGRTVSIVTSLRRRFCAHEVYIQDIKRHSEHQVTASCIRCGKSLSATYGLVLPATLLQRPRAVQNDGETVPPAEAVPVTNARLHLTTREPT